MSTIGLGPRRETTSNYHHRRRRCLTRARTTFLLLKNFNLCRTVMRGRVRFGGGGLVERSPSRCQVIA